MERLPSPLYASETLFAYAIWSYGLAEELRAIRPTHRGRCDRSCNSAATLPQQAFYSATRCCGSRTPRRQPLRTRASSRLASSCAVDRDVALLFLGLVSEAGFQRGGGACRRQGPATGSSTKLLCWGV